MVVVLSISGCDCETVGGGGGGLEDAPGSK